MSEKTGMRDRIHPDIFELSFDDKNYYINVVRGIPFYYNPQEGVWVPFFGVTHNLSFANFWSYDNYKNKKFQLERDKFFPSELFSFLNSLSFEGLVSKILEEMNFEYLCLSYLAGGELWESETGRTIATFLENNYPNQLAKLRNELGETFSASIKKTLEEEKLLKIEISENTSKESILKKINKINRWLFIKSKKRHKKFSIEEFRKIPTLNIAYQHTDIPDLPKDYLKTNVLNQRTFLIGQKWLIDPMKERGYPLFKEETDAICAGYAIKGGEAGLLGEEALYEFLQRVNSLLYDYKNNLNSYKLTLISKEYFDTNFHSQLYKDKPLLIQDNKEDGKKEYQLWGFKDNQWQLTTLETEKLKIPDEWEFTNQDVRIDPSNENFSTLKEGHTYLNSFPPEEQVEAFFDSMAIAHRAYYFTPEQQKEPEHQHPGLYEPGKEPETQKDIQWPLFISKELEEQGGLVIHYANNHEYTEETLIGHLKTLEVESKAQNKMSSFLLRGGGHRISLIYDPKATMWIVLDANYTPGLTNNIDLAAQWIKEGFIKEDKICFATWLLSSDKLTAQLQHLLQGEFTTKEAMDLVRQGADPTIVSSNGATLLHILSFYDQDLDAIKKLVEVHGVSIDIKNQQGLTPLQNLINTPNFSPKAAMNLVHLGADPTVVNKNGQTLYQLFSSQLNQKKINYSTLERINAIIESDVSLDLLIENKKQLLFLDRSKIIFDVIKQIHITNDQLMQKNKAPLSSTVELLTAIDQCNFKDRYSVKAIIEQSSNWLNSYNHKQSPRWEVIKKFHHEVSFYWRCHFFEENKNVKKQAENFVRELREFISKKYPEPHRELREFVSNNYPEPYQDEDHDVHLKYILQQLDSNDSAYQKLLMIQNYAEINNSFKFFSFSPSLSRCLLNLLRNADFSPFAMKKDNHAFYKSIQLLNGKEDEERLEPRKRDV